VGESNLEQLKIDHVTKEFGGLKALSDVDLYLNEGEILGLIGPNGAGKTTLFNVISGMYHVTKGEIYFNGHNITQIESYKRPYFAIGRTFQNIKLFGDLTVLENVMLGRHSKSKSNLFHAAFHLPLHHREEKEAKNKVLELLDFLDISKLAMERAGDLAYGQQRLVEIARALAMEPILLLLDEPCAGLNSHEAQELEKKLKITNQSGVSILCVEHNMKMIMSISDRIVVLNYGEKIAEGTPQEIIKNTKVIEAYLGKSGD
jgi:branched-chain amino acid transport system ATP-binding protein